MTSEATVERVAAAIADTPGAGDKSIRATLQDVAASVGLKWDEEAFQADLAIIACAALSSSGIEEAVKALEPFAEMAKRSDWYIAEVCPPLSWPVFREGDRDIDGPGSFTIDASDFAFAASTLSALRGER